MPSVKLLSAAVILFALIANAGPSVAGDWRDSAPHAVRFVSVEPGVRLEVLDWGGTGVPVVLLAGYNTAHVYDTFAPKLSRFAHVYGITRRGFGASSAPDAGYGAQRSADDVLGALDELHIRRPILVGHSFGGQDLDVIGSQSGERVRGLVYLNSGEDATLGADIWKVIGVDPKELDQLRDKLPLAFKSLRGHELPESELRQLFDFKPDGTRGAYKVPNRVRDAMFKGCVKPDFERVSVPALALFPTGLTPEEAVLRYKPANSVERGSLEKTVAINNSIRQEHIDELKRIPHIHIREVVDADYYIWLTNEADIVKEIHSFLAQLK